MEKTKNIQEIRDDLKYKRDTLHLAHEHLKQHGDFWNKIIIFISLASSLIETTKMKMGWSTPILELLPIFLSSVVAGISSFIKFKRYNEQQEVLIQSHTVMTSTLAKARNCNVVDDSLLRDYYEAIELLETSLYPQERANFLRISQKNLGTIISNEDKYFFLIEEARNGEDISRFVKTSPSESRRSRSRTRADIRDNLDSISDINTDNHTPHHAALYEEKRDNTANVELTTPLNEIIAPLNQQNIHETDKHQVIHNETNQDPTIATDTAQDNLNNIIDN